MDEDSLMFRSLILISCALALAGCAKREPLRSTERLTVLQGQSALPAPTLVDVSAAARPTVIGPLDKLDIRVFGVPELSVEDVQVDAGGYVSVPLIGTLAASGKSTAQLGSEIEGGLRQNYVRNPQVSVNMRQMVSQTVAVQGEVQQPGIYPVPAGTTLLRTIAAARGLTQYAKEDEVVVLRTVGGQRLAGLYSIDAIRRGNYDDPVIYANDVVIVGDSPQRRLLANLVPFVPLITSPLIVALQKL